METRSSSLTQQQRATGGSETGAPWLHGTFWTPTLYADVRRLAGTMLQQRREGDSISVTVVVHETYARIAQSARSAGSHAPDKPRAAFFALAGTVMRSVITDWVRRRIRRAQAVQPAGGPASQYAEPSDEAQLPAAIVQAEILSEALHQLSTIHPRAATVAEFRFVRGMSVCEVARALGVSDRTVELDWAGARAWLKRELIARA